MSYKRDSFLAEWHDELSLRCAIATPEALSGFQLR